MDYFLTGARNFFDHDVIGNSNIFFPLTIDHCKCGNRFRYLSGNPSSSAVPAASNDLWPASYDLLEV